MSHNITVEGGKSVRLPTAGKYCDRDIIITATGGGGGAELNIAYGDTAPEDTSKLWVKTSEPSGVIMSADKVFDGEAREASIKQYTSVLAEPQTDLSCASVGEKIYIFGGNQSNSSNYRNIIRCLDTTTRTLSTMSAVFPNKIARCGCAAVGSKIYVVGGTDGTNNYKDVYVYYTETDTLIDTELDYGSDSSSYTFCASIGSTVYVFGGCNRRGNEILNWITELDTTSNSWVNRQLYLPKQLHTACCAVIGKKIYILGGMTISATQSKDIYCYDTETHTVTTMPYSLPTASYRMGCGVVDNKIYLLGGNSTAIHIVCVDPKRETVEIISITLKTFLYEAYASTVGNDIYIFGNSSSFLQVFLAPLGTMKLENNKLQIIPKADANIFPIVNTDTMRIETGVDKVYKGDTNNEAEQVEAALYQNNEWTTI